MNKQYLIEKIVPLEDDRGTFRAEHGHGRGWNDCRSQVLKNISSLDLNGWVMVKEVVKLVEKEWEKAGKHEAPYLPILIEKIESIAPQEENKN